MSIAIDAREIGLDETGPGVYTRELTRRLADCRPDISFHLFFATRPAEGSIPRAHNLIPHVLGRPGGRKIGNLIFEQQLLPAALATHYCDLLWSPAFVLPVLKRTAHVVTVHDLIPILFAGEYSLARRLVYNPLLRLTSRRANRVVTVSDSSAEDIRRLLGVEASRVRVIPNGVDATFCPIRPREATHASSLFERIGVRGRYALSSAGLLPRKNAHRVVHAFARLARELPDDAPDTLVFTGNPMAAGGDTYWTSLVRDAETVGIADRICFSGHLSRADLRLLYAFAEWSIYVSLYEGFGLPLVEAMACACPVITSNRSSMPEVAGGAALVVDPESVDAIGSAMKLMTLDETLRAELRQGGLRRSRVFSWDEGAARLMDVFEEIVGTARQEEPMREAA